MKSYGVLCIPDIKKQLAITNVIVEADNPEEAKREAIRYLKQQGYANPIIAPESSGAQVVRERDDEDPKKNKKNLDNFISLIRELYPTFEGKVNKARSLLADYINALIKRGIKTEKAEDFAVRIVRHFLFVNTSIKYNEIAFVFNIYDLSLTQEIFNKWNNGIDKDATFIEYYLSMCNAQEKVILYQLATIIYTVDKTMTDEEYNYLSNFLS